MIRRLVYWIFNTKWKRAHPLLLDDWQHLVFTYDRSKDYTGSIFYLNGMLPENHDQDDLKRVFPEELPKLTFGSGCNPCEQLPDESQFEFERDDSFSISMWVNKK